MSNLFFGGIVLLVVLVGLDRLLLWVERKGWIYYRRTKGRRGGAVYHVLEMHSVFEPGMQQVIEITNREEREEDESGDPPAGGRKAGSPAD